MHDPNRAPLHLVLGAGQIGPRLAELLLAQGRRVRVVRRGPPGANRPGLEWARGDITDRAFAAEVARGAAVVYDCMNPAYHRWPQELLPLAEASLYAAASAKAKLVALDSVYAYGRPNGPIREDSPIAPCSRKGELRARQAELRMAAHQRGDAQVTIGRASDFFGADAQLSNFGDRFFTRIRAGRPGELFGDPDQPHSYTYVEDVAAALATLGAREESSGKIWILPTAPAQSTRALVGRIGLALGVEARVKRIPRLMLRGLGLFSPLLREMVEMTYQWEVPLVVDDRRFRDTFGWSATPTDRAVAEVARWARGRFGFAPVAGPAAATV